MKDRNISKDKPGMTAAATNVHVKMLLTIFTDVSPGMNSIIKAMSCLNRQLKERCIPFFCNSVKFQGLTRMLSF